MRGLLCFALVVSLATPIGVFAQSLRDGLSAHYSLDGTAIDSSGNGNHGGIVGATSTTDRFGYVGRAMSFDGINDYISLPNFAANQYSVFTHLKVDNRDNAGRFFEGWTGSENFAIGFQYIGNDNQNGAFIGYEGPGYYVRGSFHPWKNEQEIYKERHLLKRVDLDSSNWHSLGITFDGTIATLYHNGRKARATSFANVSAKVPNNGKTRSEHYELAKFRFGSYERGGTFFDGSLDDLSIYNRRLTDYEITRLNHGFSPIAQNGSPPSLARLETISVGANRAQQGIAWSGEKWVTSKGSLNAFEYLSRYSNEWELELDEGLDLEVVHIGDITIANENIYAPIQVGLPGFEQERIARYSLETLNDVEVWDVPQNVRLAGLENHDGNLVGVEYVENGAARVQRFEFVDDELRVDQTFLVDVPYANGIAINNDKVFVSAGSLTGSGGDWEVGEIHVFDLASFVASSGTLSAEEHGFGVYQYAVPKYLHAEGLAFRNNELWVALGDDVARLDTASIAISANQLSGFSGCLTSSMSDSDTSLVMKECNVEINESSSARNVYLFENSLTNLTGSGSLIVGGTLGVRDGQFDVTGGNLTVAELEIGGSADSNGVFSVTTESEIEVSRRLTLRDDGSLLLDQETTFHMTGSDFQNYSTDASQYGDLDKLTLVFEGGILVNDLFEVGGEDLGETGSFDNNYLLDHLQIGGVDFSRLILIDEFDNQLHSDGKEALYLNELSVLPGSILDLNGINLYVNGVQVRAGQGHLFGGGTIISSIPEPGSTSIFLFASLAVLYVRRRRCK